MYLHLYTARSLSSIQYSINTCNPVHRKRAISFLWFNVVAYVYVSFQTRAVKVLKQVLRIFWIISHRQRQRQPAWIVAVSRS